MSQRTIPSLDGVRAFAVLLVLVGHGLNMRGQTMTPLFSALVQVAHLGVNIFFVLSGFLITTLLIDEQDRTGSVSLSKFYARRAIRILPAAYLYIGVVAVLAAMGVVQLRDGDVIHAVFYTMNYHHDRAWSLGHLWSLAVEEQFYLLWPLGVVLLRRQAALRLAVGVVIAAPLMRVAWWILLPAHRDAIDEEFQLVCDALATGCALALICKRHGIDAVAATIHPLIFAAAPVMVVACLFLVSRPSLNLPFGVTCSNVAIAITLLWFIARPMTILGRVFNSRLALVLGSLSYSIYMWQQIFMDRTHTNTLMRLPMNLLLVVVVASASYLLVERPLWKLRARFRP